MSFLELNEKTTERALAKWLSKYVPPKAEPQPPSADQVFIVLDGQIENPQQAIGVVATLMAMACKQRKVALPRFSAFGNGERVTVAIKGSAAAVLSTILHRQPFLDFLGELVSLPVRVVSLRKGKIVASNGRMSAMVQMRGGAPLEVPESIEWSPFPEGPVELFADFDRALHRWAKRRATEGGEPQVIVRTGLGLLS